MITYCTNIHPGESWGEIFQNLQTFIPVIKTAVYPGKTFPIGLRLSELAATQLNERSAVAFTEWMLQNDLYVPTINGFPYGSFHTTPIKKNVYLPDWRHSDRAEYTKKLAKLLDYWLPEDLSGSISTVPIGFKSCISNADFSVVKKNITTVLDYLERLRQKSGKKIILAFEAEPGCVLETVEDIVIFFERMNFSPQQQETVGVCFDCCHHAVEFENPRTALNRLLNSGITIAKVQISSATRIINPHADILEFLSEPTYLHQVVIRAASGDYFRYNDLPVAIRKHNFRIGDEWRIHFHLPIFLKSTQWCETTQDFIEDLLPLLDKNTLLEIETYTWNVLPTELQSDNVTQSIIREIEWLKAKRI